MTDLTLAVGGRRYEGWTGATVTRSLETISGTFSIRLSEKSPGETTPRQVRPGDRCQVLLHGEAVITGWVDTVRASYDGESHEVEIAGRDATGDLVDCSAASEPGEWHDETLEAIVARLCRPFDISVRGGVSGAELVQGLSGGSPTAATLATAPFRRFRIEEGETVFEAIERGCRMRGVLPLSDGAGGIVLGRPARTRAGVRLERKVNILSASGEASWLGRYSDYTLLGQQPGNDFLSPESAAHVIAEARDAGVTRHRPLTIIAEQALDTAEAQERIDWEANVRAGRARRATITVQGWRETPEDGAPLWEPGRLVQVRDDWLGLDREMLISAVTQSTGEDGSTSTLTLYPEGAFIARIEPEAEEETTGWWG